MLRTVRSVKCKAFGGETRTDAQRLLREGRNLEVRNQSLQSICSPRFASYMQQAVRELCPTPHRIPCPHVSCGLPDLHE